MKIIRFSRGFLPGAIISAIIIASGFVAMATRGVNYGLDFKPGLITEVRIAPTALSLGYTGAARAVVATNSTALTIVVSGAGADNATSGFTFEEYPTVQHLADAVKTVPGITAEVKAGAGGTSSAAIFPDASVSTVLSASVPYRFHYQGSTETPADAVRDALAGLDDTAVQQVGDAAESRFQIRVSDTSTGSAQVTPADSAAGADTEAATGADAEAVPVAAVSEDAASSTLAQRVVNDLRRAFGDENVAIISTDFVGAQFSKSLAFKSIWVVLATLVLIWIYSTVRFKWDFALGAVLAIVHDALVMLAFIAWTQREFSTIILAAILTIIGYSINNTIVVLDRVRENSAKVSPTTPITEILNTAQTEILGRTIFTTVTTLLAVIALFIFTTGSMKDFALCLIIGMLSGVYSTIYISGAFIAFVRHGKNAVKK
jgi:preprotein translocase subunit SecF